MAPVAGVDGIRSGWIVARKDGGGVALCHAKDFAAIIAMADELAMVGVDIPIGLPDTAEPGGRACDREARRLVGPGRTSCIFSPPCRSALDAETYAEAVARNRASSADGVGLSLQAYAPFSKLRDVDHRMTPALQARVREVHPEVSFTLLREAVAGGRDGFSALQPKKSRTGRAQRIELLGRSGLGDVEALIAEGRRHGTKPDDTLDACVAAWTAERLLAGEARCLGGQDSRDGRGLRMQIWA